jgi:hypothetical protein
VPDFDVNALYTAMDEKLATSPGRQPHADHQQVSACGPALTSDRSNSQLSILNQLPDYPITRLPNYQITQS